MRVLIVCSKNSGKIAPFIAEQVDAIMQLGVETSYYTIEQKGIKGYLNSRKGLQEKIKHFRPNIIHAHYGLAGLLANLQRKVPVVTTYHGSDINNNKAFFFSTIAIYLSKFNIFVSAQNRDKVGIKKKSALIPCGVDTKVFMPKNRIDCRVYFRLDKHKKYVLFSSTFSNQVKNPKLAKQVVQKLKDVELLELKAYQREEVAMLISAVDCCLMTSYTEGSPQFIKEAMACNCPIVTVNVGDVKKVIGNTQNTFVCDSYQKEELIEKLKIVLSTDQRTNGSQRIEQLQLHSQQVAQKIKEIYLKVIE